MISVTATVKLSVKSGPLPLLLADLRLSSDPKETARARTVAHRKQPKKTALSTVSVPTVVVFSGGQDSPC